MIKMAEFKLEIERVVNGFVLKGINDEGFPFKEVISERTDTIDESQVIASMAEDLAWMF